MSESPNFKHDFRLFNTMNSEPRGLRFNMTVLHRHSIKLFAKYYVAVGSVSRIRTKLHV
jgi:hypothetical protein